MTQYNRRNFVRLSSLSILAGLLSFHEVKALSFITQLPSSGDADFQTAKELAKKAKKHFHKNEFQAAENLLLQCIGLAPSDIRFYDNLKAVYGAQGKLIKSALLFKNGLQINSQNVAFYDRMARSLMQLEVGNSKLSNQYKVTSNSNSLLKDAKKLYKDAIQIAPDKKYLKIGLKKVKRKINEFDLQIDYRTNTDYKEKKKRRVSKHKKRYRTYTIEELKAQIEKLNTKKRNTLYIDSEFKNREINCVRELKLIFKIIVKKLKQENNYQEAISYAYKWYDIIPKDSEVIKSIERLNVKSQDFQGLIDFRRYQISKHPNLWAYIGLIKAIERGHRKGLNVSLSESVSICDDLLQDWKLVGNLKISVLELKAKALLRNGQKTLAEGIYYNILNGNLRSHQIINRIVNGYAFSLLKNDKIEESKVILEAILYKKVDGSLPLIIKKHLNTAYKTPSKQLMPLRYTLYRVYKKQNRNGAKQTVLNEILAINPNDKFALKRI
ncbi:MAG: hypothetical protein JXQ93_03310 [Flavobacteriaceae bacterium]